MLLFLAGLDVVVAWSLFQPAYPVPAATRYAHDLAPLWVWGTAWAVAAAACATAAFRRDDRWGFFAAEAIKVLWASVLLGGAITGEIPRGLVAAAVWVAFAGIVWLISGWPEPSQRHRAGHP